mgnify:CR=1 FL=1
MSIQKLQFNNRTILTPSRDSFVAFTESVPPTPPVPSLPSDMDFVYLANDFDGSKIPNKATGTNAFGPYLQQGTITKNGNGSSCYLSNDHSTSNYLYIDLTSAQLNTMKPSSGAYSFFIRVQSTSSGLGAIFSWRLNNDSSYIYMIRANNGKLQLHSTTGYDSSFDLDESQVYKVVVESSTLTAYKLSTGSTFAISHGSYNMSTKMSTFNAYPYSGEGVLDRMYGLAGIARATTTEEDTQIKEYLMSQGV